MRAQAGRPAHVHQGPRGARRTARCRHSAATTRSSSPSPAPYQPDPKNLAEVLAMPAKGVATRVPEGSRGFQRAVSARIRATDPVAAGRPDRLRRDCRRGWNAQQAFVQKWADDPLEVSRDALSLVQSWSALRPTRRGARKPKRSAVSAWNSAWRRSTQAIAARRNCSSMRSDLPARDDISTRVARLASRRSEAQACRLGDAGQCETALRPCRRSTTTSRVQDAKAHAAREQQQQVSHEQDAAADRPDAAAGRADAEGVQRSGQGEGDAGAGARCAKSMQQQQQANAKANAKRPTISRRSSDSDHPRSSDRYVRFLSGQKPDGSPAAAIPTILGRILQYPIRMCDDDLPRR